LFLQGKNAKEREYIRTGVTEPISLRTCEAKQILPAAWVAETMLLSDILDFNEFQALDLLVAGINLLPLQVYA